MEPFWHGLRVADTDRVEAGETNLVGQDQSRAPAQRGQRPDVKGAVADRVDDGVVPTPTRLDRGEPVDRVDGDAVGGNRLAGRIGQAVGEDVDIAAGAEEFDQLAAVRTDLGVGRRQRGREGDQRAAPPVARPPGQHRFVSRCSPVGDRVPVGCSLGRFPEQPIAEGLVGQALFQLGRDRGSVVRIEAGRFGDEFADR